MLVDQPDVTVCRMLTSVRKKGSGIMAESVRRKLSETLAQGSIL